MKDYLLASLVVFLSLIICCGGDDNPAGTQTGQDEEFYPLAVGSVWNYSRSGSQSLNGTQIGTISGSAMIEISGTEDHSEGFEVFVQEVTVSDTVILYGQTTYIDSSYIEYLRVTDDGLYGYPHLSDADSSYSVPFPLQVGNVWAFSQEPPKTGEVLSLTASVSVPAGGFAECAEIRIIWMDSLSAITNTADFARNVGEVRNVFENAFDGYVIEVTNSLVDYDLN